MLTIHVYDRGVALLGRAVYEDLRIYKRAQFAQLRKAGNIIRRQQRADLRSGAGPGKKEGRLLSQHRVVVRSAKGMDGVLELFVGPTPGGKAFYGKFHELGTKERKTLGRGKKGKYRAGISRGRVPPKPWQREAGQKVQRQVDELMADTFTAFAAFGFRPAFSRGFTSLEKLASGV